jgi:hypothetical protein
MTTDIMNSKEKKKYIESHGGEREREREGQG